MENREHYSYRDILRIAFPILVSTIVEQVIGMTDTAFLGRVSELDLGASAIAGVYYLVIFMLGLGFSIGVQIIIGRRNGEGNYAQTGKVFYHGLYFALGLAVVTTLASEVVSPGLMGLMVSSPQVRDAALSYIRWRVIGIMKCDVAVCWTAEAVYGGFMALTCGLYLRSGRWKSKAI